MIQFTHVCLQFKPQDFWVGVYVETSKTWMDNSGKWVKYNTGSIEGKKLDIYVCVLPALPVHFQVVAVKKHPWSELYESNTVRRS